MPTSTPSTPHSPLPIPHSSQLIGTRAESSLHRDLKFSYVGQNGQIEADVAGYVADGISAGGEYIEVQTGNFGRLKRKVANFARLGKVRIIYPVIVTKYIEVFDKKGKREYRRKSPRKGSPWDIFDELIYAADLPLIPRLSIELVLIDAVEVRVRDGKGSWRRKGVSIRDRKLLAFHERILLKKPADFLRFVPFESFETFTSRSFGEKAGITTDVARKALYVLYRMKMVEKVGKQGNSIVYCISAKKLVRKHKK